MATAEPSEQQTSPEESSDGTLATLSDRAGATSTDDVTIRDIRHEVAMGLAVIAFGVFLIVVAWDLRQGAIPDPVTTRGMPIGAGVMIVVFASFPAFRALRAWRAGVKSVSSEGTDDEPGFETSILRVFAFVAASLIWTFLVPRFSYLLMTPFFLSLLLWGFGVRSWAKLTIVPIVFTAISWYLFSQVLTIRLPWGIFESWARTVGLTL